MLSLESIREKTRKCKVQAETVLHSAFLPLLVILVGLSAFALGILSSRENTSQEITQVALPLAAGTPIHIGGLFVASKKGSTYNYPWCSGARAIAVENKIWFKSIEDAQQAGYRAAKNCKGLE